MPMYFFDLQSGGAVMTDEEGRDLSDVEAAHKEALAAIGDMIRDVVLEGGESQDLSIAVRDEIGPVLEVRATLASRLRRTQ